MANSSLPQSTLDTFQPISAPSEISARAQVYLQSHPELYREALERAQRLGLYEKRRRRHPLSMEK